MTGAGRAEMAGIGAATVGPRRAVQLSDLPSHRERTLTYFMALPAGFSGGMHPTVVDDKRVEG